jgi:hypothetical protein
VILQRSPHGLHHHPFFKAGGVHGDRRRRNNWQLVDRSDIIYTQNKKLTNAIEKLFPSPLPIVVIDDVERVILFLVRT